MKDMDIFNGPSEEPTPSQGMSSLLTGAPPHFSAYNPEFDLIEEIIKEQNGLPLPGPPPPPADLFGPSAVRQSHRTAQQNPISTSNPVLVPRGTACKPNFLSQPRTVGSSKEMSSTHPSHVGTSGRGRGSSCLLAPKGPVSTQRRGDTEMLEKFLENPRLVVVEEPKDRGMRFRYECEGRSAGSIMGASSTDNNKTQPTIEIQGPIERLKKVVVTVSLVTKDLPHRPHPHCLVGKDCPPDSGICVVPLNPQSNWRHSFTNLGIQCVRRKELDVSLQKRKSQNIDPFQTGFSKGIEDIDMNSVRLCFQCELEWEDGRKDSLSPVVSKPIYDKKATTTSELKIYNLNLNRGSCRGKTEVYMLCDKVQKDDIEILFKQGSWKANGEFAQTDVHRQIAIVFKTPPFQDQNITEEVEVTVVLRRISDQMESESVKFTYLPHNPDPYEVKRKRAIKRDTSTSEKSCVAETTPPLAQTTCFHQTPNIPSPVESQVEKYPHQDHNTLDDIFNQLLEIPDFLTILYDPNLSCNLELNTNPTSADMSLNTNFGTYPQDFSQFNDIQFNMLVSGNQNPQAEPQDNMLQVTTPTGVPTPEGTHH